MKISISVPEVLSGHDFQVKFSKGNSSVNNVGGVMVSVLCTLSDDPIYLHKVS